MKLKSFGTTVATVGIFAGAALTLFFYLLGLRYHAYIPTAFFLGAAGIMVLTILYQCFALELGSATRVIVLTEVIVCNVALHLIFQLPGYGLWGSDAYADLASLKGILTSDHVRGALQYVQLTSYFPVLHVLGAQIVQVTGLDAFEVAKWFPSIIDIATVPLVFVLIRKIFRSDRAALLSALLLIALQQHMEFGSFFVRETIALVLAVSCVYFYIAAESSEHPVAYRVISMFLLGATVLAHHLTSALLVVFLAVYYLVSRLGKSRAAEKAYLGPGMIGYDIALSFVIMAAVATLAYWVNTVIVPLQILGSFVTDLLTPSSWGKGTYVDLTGMGVMLPTFRYYILIYGSYLCYVIFGLILLSKVRPRNGSRHLQTYAFTVFLAICGALGAVSFFLLPRTVIGNRFLTFAWLFAFGPLAIAAFGYRRTLAVAGVASALIAYVLINVYTIHPTEWDPTSKGSGATASFQDFSLANTVDFRQGDILGTTNNISAIYGTQNVQGSDLFGLSRGVNFDDYTWIVVNRKALEEEALYSRVTINSMDQMKRLDQEGSPGFDTVFQSNNLAVFERSR